MAKGIKMKKTSVLPLNRVFSQKYGAPGQIVSENDAKSELGRIRAFLKDYNNGVAAISEFIASRCRFIAEKFPNLRLSVVDILQILVEKRPKGTYLRNTDTRYRLHYSAEDWERESLERYESLKPSAFKLMNLPTKKGRTSSKDKLGANENLVSNAALKSDIDIILVGGNASKKKALEKELGYVVRQIQVERNAKSCSKLRALWNGTHMRDFGVIVCLCNHLAHRATEIVDTCFKGPTDWIVLNIHNDNCKILADMIKTAIRKSGRDV